MGTKTITLSLTLVRHGQTDANLGGLLQGQQNSSLSNNGKHQAELAGVALGNIRYEKIYASDLDRAFDTATIIAAKNMNIATQISGENHNNIVETNELLRERCFGINELKPHKEFVKAAQDAGFGKDDDLYEFVPEGAEGTTDVKKRAIKFLEFAIKSAAEQQLSDINSQSKKTDILIVSHSGFLRQMVIYLIKDCKCELPSSLQDIGDNAIDDLMKKGVKNTAISNFDVQIDIKTSKILSANCNKHACTKHLE